MRLVLTDDERTLVALRREFVAYVAAHTSPDPTLEDEVSRSDDDVALQLRSDGSGFVVVDPEDPNEDEYRLLSFTDHEDGARKIRQKRSAIEEARLERDREVHRRHEKQLARLRRRGGACV